MTRIVNITHTDLDGAVAAIVMRPYLVQLAPNYEIYRVGADTMRPTVQGLIESTPNKADLQLYFTDCSPADIMDLLKANPEVFYAVYDHHVTAQELHNGDNCIIDITRCGAMVAYEHLPEKFTGSNMMERLCELTNDHDMWLNRMPESHDLNNLYYMMNFDDFMARFANGFDGFNEAEQAMLDKYNSEFAAYYSSLYRKNLPCNGVYLLANKYISDICMAVEAEHYTWYIIERAGDNGVNLSVRTRNGVHIGFILKNLGIGGGHASAGGVFIPKGKEITPYIAMICDEIEKALNGSGCMRPSELKNSKYSKNSKNECRLLANPDECRGICDRNGVPCCEYCKLNDTSNLEVAEEDD